MLSDGLLVPVIYLINTSSTIPMHHDLQPSALAAHGHDRTLLLTTQQQQRQASSSKKIQTLHLICTHSPGASS
uniref:Uncharacterized protein n=1 Tax=Ectopseudomonas oleovorans TaxID=301 RepID=A0A653B7T5_ECTOL